MSKKLAIKGHATRGEEVIKILEMMGGKISNECTYESGFDTDYFFFICEEEKNLIDGISHKDKEFLSNYICFTLEEFLEKYPFKVGDKVEYFEIPMTITKMVWEANSVCYKLNDKMYTNEMYKLKPYKETDTVTPKFKIGDEIGNVNGLTNSYIVTSVSPEYYGLEAPNNSGVSVLPVNQQDEYILVNRMEENEVDLILKGEMYHGNRIVYTIPDGYEVSKIENGEIILQKKKPTYPNNFDDCFNMVSDKLNDNKEIEYFEYKYDLLDKFKQLLICRDAYWKIAGEQMGLGKPWEPDWKESNGGYRYVIFNVSNKITLNCEWLGENHVLSFPTAEMRDAFYENFKEIIEQCKELL